MFSAKALNFTSFFKFSPNCYFFCGFWTLESIFFVFPTFTSAFHSMNIWLHILIASKLSNHFDCCKIIQKRKPPKMELFSVVLLRFSQSVFPSLLLKSNQAKPSKLLNFPQFSTMPQFSRFCSWISPNFQLMSQILQPQWPILEVLQALFRPGPWLASVTPGSRNSAAFGGGSIHRGRKPPRWNITWDSAGKMGLLNS